MGAGVSDWRLALAVAKAGHLGVVSGTALAEILSRRLQDGDVGGHMRRGLAAFPIPGIAEEIQRCYFQPDGKPPGTGYKRLPMYSIRPSRHLVAMTLAANFVEVHLAKQGHNGLIGINYLEKIQLPNLVSMYGAMLAGVDYVLMGAGIPRDIPAILDRLARHEPVKMNLHLEDSPSGVTHSINFHPLEWLNSASPAALHRPTFLAIIASASLATILARKATGAIGGFVVELPSAGGHNAPPRGEVRFNDRGEPIYGEKDKVDFAAMRGLGLPFWLAGGFGHPDRIKEAQALGAQGIQVGTAFAFCQESGLAESLKRQVIDRARDDRLDILTDGRASPTGFPFKVVELPGTLSEAELYNRRRRVCDLGYLRQAYVQPKGGVGYRCPGEPEADFVAKGGALEDTQGRKCLCNALLANLGSPQLQTNGDTEIPLLTAGDDVRQLKRFLTPGATSYGAHDVIHYLLSNEQT